tara:strand:+ start:673 stop:1527 length:855 start_codon:yes stop_codon:yes gene_type:complete
MTYGKRITWLEDRKKRSVRNFSPNKDIVLFDMDGTLTEPRKPFDKVLTDSLRELSQVSDIGIVSGSDYDYIAQQLEFLLFNSEMRYKIHLLPCNGTKYYKPPNNPDENHKLVYSVNMKDELGEDKFKQLMVGLIQFLGSIDLYKFPLTGHFIQYRESIVNWSPIGRNAKDKERAAFIEYDNSISPSYRKTLIDLLKRNLTVRGVKVDIKLGGDTSLDIYPPGWDKTYCLKHFKTKKCWFVGDRCDSDGNDKELYELLKQEGRAFKTESPANTKLIISEDILKHF